jgi:DNA polymerase-3 subunit delta'
MMIDRLAGNAALKDSIRLMLGSSRLTHSVLLVGETGLGAGYAARCVAADYLYPAGGAPAEALLRGECCRAVGKPGDRDSGHVETGIVREAISVAGMGAGGKYLVSQVKAMRSEIFNTSLSAEGRAVLLYHVERMNEESANALLKVMEEPPEGVLFLLTADSLAGVLPTIRSRCVSFAVAPVSPADCTRYCAAQGVDKKTAALYSELFDGHIGTVLAVT